MNRKSNRVSIGSDGQIYMGDAAGRQPSPSAKNPMASSSESGLGSSENTAQTMRRSGSSNRLRDLELALDSLFEKAIGIGMALFALVFALVMLFGLVGLVLTVLASAFPPSEPLLDTYMGFLNGLLASQ